MKKIVTEKNYNNHPLMSIGNETWKKKLEKCLFDSSVFIISVLMIIFGVWLFTLPISKYNGSKLIKTLFYDAFKPTQIKEIFLIFASFLLGSLAVLICFKIGVINLGISGQMAFSGLTIYFIAYQLKKLNPELLSNNHQGIIILWILFFFIIGITAAVLLSLFCGVLKYYFHISEILSTIMTNYIVFYVYRYFVTLNEITNGTKQATNVAIGETMEFNIFFSVFSLSLLISITIFLFWCFILKMTRFGFSLKLMGISEKITKYSGVNYSKKILLIFLFSGILAGIAGIFYYYRDPQYTNLSLEDALPSNGFDTITIVWLSRSSFFSLPFASLLISLIRVQQKVILISTIDPTIAEIIIGSLVLGITFFNNKLFTKKNGLLIKEKWIFWKNYYHQKRKVKKNI